MENLVGHKVAERYRITAVLGAGGMGVVYRAHDERLEREVAVKVLAPGVLADDRIRKRFRKEALALSRLNHPNIAAVYDFVTEGGHDFIVMELIPGQTLDQKLKEGALPEREVLALGKQLAEALAAAHESGVIHRDLKPANLRFTGDQRIKVLDFGLAEVQSGPTAELTTASLRPDSSVSGTLPYMAPEQLRGEPPDVRSDIYAAGAVLYEMATGKRAFSQSGFVIVDAILNQIPPRPSQWNPQLSSGLESAIVKSIDKNPRYRYQTSRDLLAELERLTSGATVSTIRLPVAAAPPPRKRGLFAVLAVLIAAVVLLGILRSYRKAAQPATSTSAQPNVAETAPNAAHPEAGSHQSPKTPTTPAPKTPPKTVPGKTEPDTDRDEDEASIPPLPSYIEQQLKDAMRAQKDAMAAAGKAPDSSTKGNLEREGDALGVIGTIIGAAATYHSKLGYYPTSIPVMFNFMREMRQAVGKPVRANPNLCEVEPCMVHGYQITYTRPNPQSYAVQARPIAYPYTGKRSFYADESGSIRATEQDRAATVNDPVAH